MAIRIFCMKCGSPIELDDSRDYCFCIYCGCKIDIAEVKANFMMDQNPQNAISEQIVESNQLTTMFWNAVDSGNVLKPNMFSYDRESVCSAI